MGGNWKLFWKKQGSTPSPTPSPTPPPTPSSPTAPPPSVYEPESNPRGDDGGARCGTTGSVTRTEQDVTSQNSGGSEAGCKQICDSTAGCVAIELWNKGSVVGHRVADWCVICVGDATPRTTYLLDGNWKLLWKTLDSS